MRNHLAPSILQACRHEILPSKQIEQDALNKEGSLNTISKDSAAPRPSAKKGMEGGLGWGGKGGGGR